MHKEYDWNAALRRWDSVLKSMRRPRHRYANRRCERKGARMPVSVPQLGLCVGLERKRRAGGSVGVRFAIPPSSELFVSRPMLTTSAQPPQGFKIIVEGLYNFDRLIGPFRFNYPITVAAT